MVGKPPRRQKPITAEQYCLERCPKRKDCTVKDCPLMRAVAKENEKSIGGCNNVK